MAKIYLTTDEHLGFIKESVAKGPNLAILTTFGVYAGVLSNGDDAHAWGHKYQSHARFILDELRAVKSVKILVGVPEFMACKPQCEDCASKYVSQTIRLYNHAESFNFASWRFATGLHLKVSLFYYPDGSMAGVAGGRNLTGSTWEDVSVELSEENVELLSGKALELWSKALPVTMSNLQSFIDANLNV